MQVEEMYIILGIKKKKASCSIAPISLLEDYNKQTSSGKGNQNAEFALVH